MCICLPHEANGQCVAMAMSSKTLSAKFCSKVLLKAKFCFQESFAFSKISLKAKLIQQNFAEPKLVQQNFADSKTLSAKFCWWQNSISKILLIAKLIQQNIGQTWFNSWRVKAIIYKKACVADETSRAYLKAKLPDSADGFNRVYRYLPVDIVRLQHTVHIPVDIVRYR